MNDDLFPDCRRDSPRKEWMDRHGVTVRPTTMFERVCIAEADDIDAVAECLFMASVLKPNGNSRHGLGPTEDEAIAALGIPMWHEEAYQLKLWKEKHHVITYHDRESCLWDAKIDNGMPFRTVCCRFKTEREAIASLGILENSDMAERAAK